MKRTLERGERIDVRVGDWKFQYVVGEKGKLLLESVSSDKILNFFFPTRTEPIARKKAEAIVAERLRQGALG